MNQEKNYYFIVSESFALEHNGKKSRIAPDTFVATELPDGRWVCSVNSISSFPEIFENKSFSVEALTSDNFIPVESVGEKIVSGARGLIERWRVNELIHQEKEDKEEKEYIYEGGDDDFAWVVGTVVIGFVVIIIFMQGLGC